MTDSRLLVSSSVALLMVACSGDGDRTADAAPADTTLEDAADTVSTLDASITDTTSTDASQPSAPDTTCERLGLPTRPFDADGPYGVLRHDVAEDFSLELVTGETFLLSERATGCDVVVFVVDTIPISEVEPVSNWEQGVAELLEDSPDNARYIFLSRREDPAQAAEAAAAMQARIDDALAALPAADAEHWGTRLHVAAEHALAQTSWIGGVAQIGIGRLGFAIDRAQRIRGVGTLADVTRPDPRLQAAGTWPWPQHIRMVSHEVRYANFEAEREARLAATQATVVPLWTGEVIEQFDDMTITLPDAATLATFDTLELDVTQRCPDAFGLEPGNCGEWDYLAHFWLFDGDSADSPRVELARLITTYSREGRWIIDITPALALLREGGERRFRWEWAPEWNKQPTATMLSLRFSNQGKGARPATVTSLWEGRAFDSNYNEDRERIEVAIPADAVKVELWAIVTGHGGDTNNCAEFCEHQHQFVVNGVDHFLEFPAVTDRQGCELAVDRGVVPNQWGTWWLGRGGWCPGQEVEPWVLDVTDAAAVSSSLSIDYFGWYRLRTPPDASGNIVLRSFVVTYESL